MLAQIALFARPIIRHFQEESRRAGSCTAPDAQWSASNTLEAFGSQGWEVYNHKPW